MLLCPYCTETNLEGTLFCEECGTPLLGDDISNASPTRTRQLSKLAIGSQSVAPVIGGTTTLDADSILVLLIENQHRIKLEQQAEIVLGRTDEKTHIYPDVDLTSYAAIENGVSRTHAAIRRTDSGVTLVDLGSANGTYLNGKAIKAYQPHILRDGDELRFGKLVSRIYFT
jgi:pSer/pThr/pTyr-binding forkhead associated (FHA) protein